MRYTSAAIIEGRLHTSRAWHAPNLPVELPGGFRYRRKGCLCFVLLFFDSRSKNWKKTYLNASHFHQKSFTFSRNYVQILYKVSYMIKTLIYYQRLLHSSSRDGGMRASNFYTCVSKHEKSGVFVCCFYIPHNNMLLCHWQLFFLSVLSIYRYFIE